MDRDYYFEQHRGIFHLLQKVLLGTVHRGMYNMKYTDNQDMTSTLDKFVILEGNEHVKQ